MAGRTGMRYGSAIAYLERFGENLGITDLEESFQDIQIIEAALLEAHEEIREEQRDKRDQ